MKTEKRSSEFSNDEYVKLHQEAETFRKLAFFGIFIATTAILVGIVAIPSLYGYLQRVHTSLQLEADYCKSATGTLWRQVAQTQVAKNVIRADMLHASGSLEEMMTRHKRQAGYGDEGVTGHSASGSVAASAAQPTWSSVAQTCSCRIGPAGEAGHPGSDGHDGSDGQPGTDGHPGPDAESPNAIPKAEDFCFSCEASPPGPPGKAGPKGNRGHPGPAGQAGAPGNAGKKGQAGPPGAPGNNGSPGEKGTPGSAGQLSDVQGAPGPAGPAGPQGPPGQPGQPGSAGKPGQPGHPGPAGDAGAAGQPGKAGEKGENGPDGEQGGKGACDHCPPPRSAPGY